MNCHGKCEMKKESEKSNSPFNIVKIGFEFNILPTKSIELPQNDNGLIISEKFNFSWYQNNLSEGFFRMFSPPPKA